MNFGIVVNGIWYLSNLPDGSEFHAQQLITFLSALKVI